jgi:hypothetical protein
MMTSRNILTDEKLQEIFKTRKKLKTFSNCCKKDEGRASEKKALI